jgi:hypothetical protein
MEKWTFALIGLLAVLFLGPIIYQETFVDASDNSGAYIKLSLTDLMSLVGSTQAQQASRQTQQQPIIITQPSSYGGGASGVQNSLDTQFYSSLKDSIVSDVRQSVHDELLNASSSGTGASGGLLGQTVLNDSCIDSMAEQQGSDFMRYIPGKNPADYVRKDSIPCYGCSLK